MMVLWLRFLTEIEDGIESIPDDFQENEEIKQALEILQESSFTQKELVIYESYWDSMSKERTLISEKTAKAREEGVAATYAKAVINMYKNGHKPEQIAVSIGLAIGKVNAIPSKVGNK